MFLRVCFVIITNIYIQRKVIFYERVLRRQKCRSIGKSSSKLDNTASLGSLPLIAPSRSYIIWKWRLCTINHCYRRRVPDRFEQYFLFLKEEGRWRVDVATTLVGRPIIESPLAVRRVHCIHFRLSLKPGLFPPSLSKHADHWNEIMRRVPAVGHMLTN